VVLGKIGKSLSGVTESNLASVLTAEPNVIPHALMTSNISLVRLDADAPKDVPMNVAISRSAATNQNRATRRGSCIGQNRASPSVKSGIRAHECAGDYDLKLTRLELKISKT